ncbi:putative Kunitz-type serine protease inhibitor isoform X2 [Talpa occidentalis]|uniref:putative Kunitz-type serine protease inhibitor isoform X2 n=1 Tax=Talpa occidentalis TaxID=50954 RepID=UPI0023F8DDD0|nr:putative Kunitz-type serine protease inhibitor isoform X2 [Talpa occidentalis]
MVLYYKRYLNQDPRKVEGSSFFFPYVILYSSMTKGAVLQTLKMSPFKMSTALLVLLTAMLTTTQCDATSNPDDMLPAFCLESSYTGPCKASFTRWFFNINSGFCEKFVYGGCRRKLNHFLTEEECKSTCMGKKLVGPVKREVTGEDAEPAEGELPPVAEELATAKEERAPEGEEPAPKALEFEEEQESFEDLASEE